jgi:hypothetical protein
VKYILTLSSIFRDLLSLAQTPSQRDPIIFTDKVLEHSWVVESLLDSVYLREVTCLGNYDGTRAVIDLAEKWDFHHVVKLVKFHFLHDKSDQLSVRRLTLAMALNEKGAANKYVRDWHEGVWVSSGTLCIGIGTRKPPPATGNLYLHGCLAAKLLGQSGIVGGRIFDLGTWDTRSYLQLSPTTAWALLRARHLATTVPCEVDGAKFQAEFAKLLDIIMPVSTSFTDRNCI